MVKFPTNSCFKWYQDHPQKFFSNGIVLSVYARVTEHTLGALFMKDSFSINMEVQFECGEDKARVTILVKKYYLF